MTTAALQALQDAIAARDDASVLAIVRGLPADDIPEAYKLVSAIQDASLASEAAHAVADRADDLGVALGA